MNLTCPAEYEYIFCDLSMTRVEYGPRKVRIATVSPCDEFPGYWNCDLIAGSEIEGFNKPISKSGAAIALRDHWKIPSDGWNPCSHDAAGYKTFSWNYEEKRREPQKKKTIYFLKAGPFIKIGFTTGNPAWRIIGLQTGCPYPITLLATICGTARTERQLHRKFAKHRTTGEWFHEVDEILNFIRNNMEAA